MRAYTVKVIDASGRFHRYVQLSSDSRDAEAAVWHRFGAVRMMSIIRLRAWWLPRAPAQATAA